MTKGNKISDVEIYCIEKMTLEGKSVDEISDFPNRDARTVKKYSDNVEVPEVEEVVAEESVAEEGEERYAKPNKKTTHFLHETGEKGNKGVTIMTPNESSRADETRSLRLSQNTKRNIHKISNDE